MASQQGLELPATLRWQDIAGVKQREREALVSQWSQKMFGTSKPRLPPAMTKRVRDWPVQSGHLSERQIEITSSVPSRILQMIRNRTWSAEEVFLAFSIRAVIAHHLTNPFTDVFFEKGLARAQQLDEHLNRTGSVIGPLHGLPLSLKDIMRLEGHATTFGFVAFSDNIAKTSDDIVSRFFEAGAIFYCKTNVPQSLMSGECNNFLYGRTSTPDNLDLSAGGSSGGEGSLVALRGSPLGIGTDIAGSIRTPANFNGVYGLCPTYGRFPGQSVDFSSVGLINAVVGPLSSSVDGLEVYARTVLSLQPWKWDPMCLELPWNQEVYAETRKRTAEKRLCFGFVAHDDVVRPHPPIERGMRETREALTKAGHQVVDVDLVRQDDMLWDIAMRIFCADGGESLREHLKVLPEPPIDEIFQPEASMALSAAELHTHSTTLIKIRQTFLRRWQDTATKTQSKEPVDVFILPSGGHVAPPHGTMEYFLYEAISNIIDWPCATIPVGYVNSIMDPVPSLHDDFLPMSKDDKKNWEKYSPERYENGAICLQILGPRFSEEKVLACMRAVDEALGRSSEHMA